MLQNKLLETILIDNFHIEVIKRSSKILIFLIENNGLDKVHLD